MDSVRWGEEDQWPVRPPGGNFGNLEDFWNFLEFFGRGGKWMTIYPHGGNGSLTIMFMKWAPVLLSRLRHSQLMGGTSGPRSFSPLLSNGLGLLLRPGNPSLRDCFSTVDLLALTSFDQLMMILKLYVSILQNDLS